MAKHIGQWSGCFWEKRPASPPRNMHAIYYAVVLSTVLLVSIADGFDMNAFDKLFADALKNPETQVVKKHTLLQLGLACMDIEAIENALAKGESPNDLGHADHSFSNLILSVWPHFWALSIENMLSKWYLANNGSFPLFGDGADTNPNPNKLFSIDNMLSLYNTTLSTARLQNEWKSMPSALYVNKRFIYRKWFTRHLGPHLDVPSLLLEHGADVLAIDDEGNTALHMASFTSHHKTIKVLLQHGAAVNARNNVGNTPLHILSAAGDIRSIRLLIKHGADVLASNLAHQTPFSLAILYHPANLKLQNLVQPKAYPKPFLASFLRNEHQQKQALLAGTVEEPQRFLKLVIASWENASWSAASDDKYESCSHANAALTALERLNLSVGRTDIPRVSNLDLDTFINKYYDSNTPVIITSWKDVHPSIKTKKQFIELWNRKGFLQNLGDQKVSVGPIPYTRETCPSQVQPKTTIREYVNALYSRNLTLNKTTNVQSYLFDSESLPPAIQDNWKKFCPYNRNMHNHHCYNCNKDGVGNTLFGVDNIVQLTIGGSGAGAPIHFHAASFSTLLVGRKHWIMYPPERTFYTNVPTFEWLETEYSQYSKHALHFTQHPGEVIFVPRQWGHGTMILDDISVSFAENLRQDYQKFSDVK